MNVIEQWNRAAKPYMEDQEQSEFVRVNKQVVMERFPALDGRKALDLGCGYGWYTDYFRSVGADVTGCDGSEEMLNLARQNFPACTFDQTDFANALPYNDNAFDLVFCNQVLMDVDPIDGLIAETHRILKPGGVFYMGIVHPAFYDSEWRKDENGFRDAKIIARYLSEYHFDNPFWGETRHYHRTIGHYLNTITAAGFHLVHFCEPVSYDGVRKSKELPLFLFAEFVRT